MNVDDEEVLLQKLATASQPNSVTNHIGNWLNTANNPVTNSWPTSFGQGSGKK